MAVKVGSLEIDLRANSARFVQGMARARGEISGLMGQIGDLRAIRRKPDPSPVLSMAVDAVRARFESAAQADQRRAGEVVEIGIPTMRELVKRSEKAGATGDG